MEFDYRAAGFWFGVAQWISQGVVVVWVYLRTKDTDNQKAVARVENELAAFVHAANKANEAQNTRLTKLEVQLEHMPTDDEISTLAGEVAALKSQLNGVAGLLSRVEHQTTLIHEHLLNTKR